MSETTSASPLNTAKASAANLPMQAAGKQWMRLRPAREGYDGPNVYVLTLLGRLFMGLPFQW